MTLQINPDRIRELATQGLTLDEIAARLGVSRRTLFRRKVADPEIATAWEQGREEWAEKTTHQGPQEPPSVAEALSRARTLSESELAIVASAAAKGATETAIAEALDMRPRSGALGKARS